jgi:uncharacterized protein (TIGR03437 family)
VRVHFTGFDASEGRVWVYAPNADPETTYTARGLNNDGDFWSGTVEGDTLVIEYEGPDGSELPFRTAEIAHFWQEVEPPAPSPIALDRFIEPLGVEYAAGGTRSVASCHLDYKCYPEWVDAGRSVAHIVFQSGADSRFYVCTGALLNTRNSDFTPYFLTANHCIGSDTEARTLQAYWFYETSQCNGPAVTRSVATRVDGARLLATQATGNADMSLVQLNALPQAAVWFSGWQTTEPALGDALTGIHHPDGSYKRISFGVRATDRATNVDGVPAPAEKYYQVLMNEGRIEGGSSGSPLFNANKQVVGSLSYGPIPAPGRTECDIANFRAGYGRFSEFFPNIRQFLENGTAGTVSVAPQSLTFQVVDGVVTSAQTIQITTTSANPLPLTISANASWIRVTPASGSLSAATPLNAEVTVSTGNLNATGNLDGLITIQVSGGVPVTVPVRLQVSATRASVAASISPSPVYEQPADFSGYKWFFEITLAEKAGVDARITVFRVDGVDYASNVVQWFGTDRVPRLGSIRASLRSRDLQVPVDRVFEFGGTDANGQTWSTQLTVRFTGPRTQAALALSSDPPTVSQNMASADCPWRHFITIQEQSGTGVNLNRWIAGTHDLSSDIATWFGSTRLEARGSLRAGICWTGIRTPATLSFEIGGRDDSGNDVQATAEVRFVASAQLPPLRVTPDAVVLTNTSQLSLSFGGQRVSWTARVEYLSAARGWVTMFPASGTGEGTIALRPFTSVLSPGIYEARVILEAPLAEPARVEVPVRLLLGVQPAAPRLTAASVVNAASYRTELAPGMLFTIMGENLAIAEQQATRVPLPLSMSATTVRVNGVLCPILYASSRQINAQIPYETVPGAATLVVNAAGAEATARIEVRPHAPGVFTQDGTRPVPQNQARRGEAVTMFITGSGAVSPAVPTGDTPAQANPNLLPRPTGTVAVSIGGVPAQVLFAGIPRGLVGVVQVNFVVPESAPTGDSQLSVTVGGASAPAAVFRVIP